jgi:hypothetical protein
MKCYLELFETFQYLCWFNQKKRKWVLGWITGESWQTWPCQMPWHGLRAEGTFPLLIVISHLRMWEFCEGPVFHWNAQLSALCILLCEHRLCGCLHMFKRKCKGMVEKGVTVVIISSYNNVILNFAVGRSECKVERSVETGHHVWWWGWQALSIYLSHHLLIDVVVQARDVFIQAGSVVPWHQLMFRSQSENTAKTLMKSIAWKRCLLSLIVPSPCMLSPSPPVSGLTGPALATLWCQGASRHQTPGAKVEVRRGVTGSCEPPYGLWEQNLGSLPGQTTELPRSR